MHHSVWTLQEKNVLAPLWIAMEELQWQGTKSDSALAASSSNVWTYSQKPVVLHVKKSFGWRQKAKVANFLTHLQNFHQQVLKISTLPPKWEISKFCIFSEKNFQTSNFFQHAKNFRGPCPHATTSMAKSTTWRWLGGCAAAAALITSDVASESPRRYAWPWNAWLLIPLAATPLAEASTSSAPCLQAQNRHSTNWFEKRWCADPKILSLHQSTDSD